MSASSTLVVHVAEVEIGQETGMGRIAWHWRAELERRGHEFIHIGPSSVGPLRHRGQFPFKAWSAYRRLKRPAALFLVHEPAAGAFVRRGAPLAVVSHGLERRSWHQRLSNPALSEGAVSLKTRLLYPFWRLRQCDRGVKGADLLLLSNSQDREFAQAHYDRSASHIRVFRNGADSFPLPASQQPTAFTVMFNASWIPRKGIETLAAAARRVAQRQLPVKWILAGTHAEAPSVFKAWPRELESDTLVIPSFRSEQERELLTRTSVFVLPSFYEGQPLSLLQAMAAGRCCIASDCCGQRDLIQHGQNGLLFSAGDADALADRLEDMFRDDAMRRRLGQQAQASVGDRCWRAVSAEVADCLHL
jgi:glycosyltransferase involved in cell wall biosynthesis